MSKLEKIIYLADLTGLDRTYPDVDVLRKIVEVSLDEGLIYALKYTVTSLISKEQPIHPDTLNAYNDLIGSRK
jgi:HD superfamily phosphohydrolase YqeK